MEKIKVFKPKDIVDYVALSKKYESMDLNDTQEVAVIGYTFILKRVKQLGLTITDFEPLEIIYNENHEDYFKEGFKNSPTTLAAFTHTHNSIGFRNKPNLSVLTHEMIHYFSANENIPNAVNNEEKLKSGFHSSFLSEGFGRNAGKDHFQCLNEGITDKLTYDLYKNVSGKDIGNVFRNIFPTKAKKDDEFYEKQLVQNIDSANNKRAELILEANSIEDENKKTEEIQRVNEMIDRSIKVKKDYREKQSERCIVEDFIKDIHDEEGSLYKMFIDLVDQLLEGVTLIKQKEFQSEGVEQAKQLAWLELQKAYFTGNTVYLRVFENIYGEGFLRKLATLDIDSATIIEGEWIELENLFKIIREKNKELSESL